MYAGFIQRAKENKEKKNDLGQNSLRVCVDTLGYEVYRKEVSSLSAFIFE